MGKAERVLAVGLREVWASFWPEKNREANEEAFDEWLESVKEEYFNKGAVAGFKAGRDSSFLANEVELRVSRTRRVDAERVKKGDK